MNFKENLMGKKKVIFIVCFIFAVALIAAILHMVSGGGKDSAKNILYADKVSVITGCSRSSFRIFDKNSSGSDDFTSNLL